MSDANIHVISLASVIIYAIYHTALFEMNTTRDAGMLVLHAHQACMHASSGLRASARTLAPVGMRAYPEWDQKANDMVQKGALQVLQHPSPDAVTAPVGDTSGAVV